MNNCIYPSSRIMIALIFLIATIPHIGAGQVKPLTADELARRADVVVVGKVTAMKSEWNSDKSRILTRVTVAVDQYIKGEGGDRYLTITAPGGEIDGVGELYSHSVRFVNDEMVVLFAEKDRQGGLRVAGGDEGKYTIRKSEVTGVSMVSDDRPLEEFITRIKSAIRSEGGQ